MLHIILLILKILGILLLIIAGILFLILFSVLFVAAGYRVQIEKHGAFRISVRIGWLFRIVSVHASLDSSAGWKHKLQLRLFGFPVWDPWAEKKTRKKKHRRRKKEKSVEPEPVSRTEPERKTEPQPLPEFSEPNSEAEIRPEKEQRNDAEKERQKPSLPEKIRTFFRKAVYAIRGICDKIKHIREKISELGDRIRSLIEKKDALVEFWNLEEHRRARGALLQEAKYLWKKYRPRRIEGTITFGFDDPALTGLCMGGAGMLYAWYPKKLQIIPDFEHVILEGDVLIRGKVRFYVVALILLRIYFNRDIRQMYEHWKQL